MDRKKFFLDAIKYGRYKEKSWVFSIFTIKRWNETEYPEESEHYCIFVKDGVYHTHLPNKPYTPILENDEPIPSTKTILDITEEFVLSNGDLPIVDRGIITTPGNIFINVYCLLFTFGKKIKFIEGKLNPDKLVDIVKPLIVDNVPKEQRSDDDKVVYVDEVVNFLSAITSIASFAPLNVPSATPFTITTSPKVKQVRDELFKKYEGQLDDPAIIAEITKHVVNEDKAWIDQDPDKGFLDIKKKSFNVNRKKLFGLGGLEYNLSGTDKKLIRNSLSEGIDLENFQYLVDATRYGSFSRGALTALGGVEVKFIFRAFNTSTIVKDDCGCNHGLVIEVTADKLENCMSRYAIINNKLVQITPDNIDELKKLDRLMLRSPGYCIADEGGRHYCLKCFGETFKGSETSLAVYGSMVASEMNGRFMGAMHGKPVITELWVPRETIS